MTSASTPENVNNLSLKNHGVKRALDEWFSLILSPCTGLHQQHSRKTIPENSTISFQNPHRVNSADRNFLYLAQILLMKFKPISPCPLLRPNRQQLLTTSHRIILFTRPDIRCTHGDSGSVSLDLQDSSGVPGLTRRFFFLNSSLSVERKLFSSAFMKADAEAYYLVFILGDRSFENSHQIMSPIFLKSLNDVHCSSNKE